MTFIKLMLFDIHNGILRKWRPYSLCFLIVILLDTILYVILQNAGVTNSEILNAKLTLGDYILYPLAGMRRYIPEDNLPFVFPALWLFIILYFSYITLNYPNDDLHGFGINTLILSKKRSYWWLSKCCWLFFSVFIYFVIICISSLLFTVISKGEISLNISEFMPQILQLNLRELTAPPWDITKSLCLVPLTVFSVCLIQMLLSLFIKPLLSFLFLLFYY